jgi:hypothetical protein
MKKQKAPSAKPKAAKPARKPRVEYTPELAALVLDLLVDGKTLKEVEALPGMPSRTQVFRWRQEHEEFASSYRDALDARADGLADDVEDIVHQMQTGEIEAPVGREIIGALKWAASVRAPQRYGQKVSAELTGKDGGPIEMNENPNRLLDLARGIALILTDATPLTNGEPAGVDKLLLGATE